jgi:alkaline phosphatase D
MIMKRTTAGILFIMTLLFVIGCTTRQTTTTELQGTPITGDVTMRSAQVWMQLTQDSEEVTVSVLDSTGSPFKTYNTLKVGVSKNALCKINGLEPGGHYTYFVQEQERVISDTLDLETQPLWQYRTDPPTTRIALGSCTYINETTYDRPGKPYGGGYEIFNTIAAEEFDAMLWLGDNTYLREADFGSFEGYVHRYNHTRSNSQMQNLLREGVHYAIWDDHDFGPNDCDGSFIHKDWALKAFDAFWPNPPGSITHAPELNATAFQLGDADVFLLDNRSHRVNHKQGNDQRQMLGSIQMKWLLNNLKNSKAPFKLIAVGGQMLSNAAIYENFAQFPEERDWLLSELDRLKIRGVVFLTGDRHNSELTSFQLPNGNWVYDLTVSPLTASSYDHSDEPNSLRVPSTMVGQRNYGFIEITGPRKERKLRMKVKDADGITLWTRRINASAGYILEP